MRKTDIGKSSESIGIDKSTGDKKISHETNFYGSVTGPVSTGSGDMQVQNKPTESTHESMVSPKRRFSRALWIGIGAIAALVLGVASDIVATYLQDRYKIISDQGRFLIVAIVFVVALVFSIFVALKQSQESN